LGRVHHLRRRGHTYFFRLRWPVRLAAFGASGELIRSLRTSNRQVAVWLARILALKIEAMMLQSPVPSRHEVESCVRSWIDQRAWAQEVRRAENNGFDFLEVDEVENLGDEDALELEALLRFAGNWYNDDRKKKIATTLRGERDPQFDPIIESAAKVMGKSVDPSTVSGRLWARSILRGFATLLEETRTAVALIPRQIAATSEITYPTFDFLMHWDAFEAHKISVGDWKDDTASNARGAANVFMRLHPGVTIKEICTTSIVSDFKTKLLSMNRDYSRGEWKTMNIDVLIAKVKQLKVSDPKWPKTKSIKMMTTGTVNKHLSNLSEYWDFLVEKKLIADTIKDPFLGFHTPQKQGRAARDERNNWPEELDKKFFESPWIQGCKSIHRRSVPGTEIHRDAMLWVTLWGRLTGVRANEIADAVVGDIKWGQTKEGTIAYLEVRDGKDSGSERNVPVPDLLLGMGFLEYRVIGRDAAAPLFPDLIPQGPGLRRSAAYSGKFTTLRKSSGCYFERIDFHSYRGGVETALQNADGIKESWIDELIGHESDARKGEGRRYTKAIWLPILRRCVNLIRIDADLSHLKYNGPQGRPAPGRDQEIQRYVTLASREMNKKLARRIARPAGV
jgi:hypothetical protein